MIYVHVCLAHVLLYSTNHWKINVILEGIEKHIILLIKYLKSLNEYTEFSTVKLTPTLYLELI